MTAASDSLLAVYPDPTSASQGPSVCRVRTAKSQSGTSKLSPGHSTALILPWFLAACAIKFHQPTLPGGLRTSPPRFPQEQPCLRNNNSRLCPQTRSALLPGMHAPSAVLTAVTTPETSSRVPHPDFPDYSCYKHSIALMCVSPSSSPEDPPLLVGRDGFPQPDTCERTWGTLPSPSTRGSCLPIRKGCEKHTAVVPSHTRSNAAEGHLSASASPHDTW